MKNIAILHTIRGKRYTDLIGRELSRLNVNVTIAPWTDFMPLKIAQGFPSWDLLHIRFGGLGSSLQLIKTLDTLGFDLINNAFCVEYTTNKFLGTLVAEKQAKVKTPKTILIDKRFASDMLRKINYPVVLKPLMSHQGRYVSKIDSYNQLMDYLSNYRKRIVMVQEFVSFNKLFRAIVVGNRVIDLAFEIPKEGWKATVCLNPNVKKHKVTSEIEKFCFKLKTAFKGEILAIDFFETGNGYCFNEINNACNLYHMQKATNVNHAKEIACYLHKRVKE